MKFRFILIGFRHIVSGLVKAIYPKINNICLDVIYLFQGNEALKFEKIGQPLPLSKLNLHKIRSLQLFPNEQNFQLNYLGIFCKYIVLTEYPQGFPIQDNHAFKIRSPCTISNWHLCAKIVFLHFLIHMTKNETLQFKGPDFLFFELETSNFNYLLIF